MNRQGDQAILELNSFNAIYKLSGDRAAYPTVTSAAAAEKPAAARTGSAWRRVAPLPR